MSKDVAITDQPNAEPPYPFPTYFNTPENKGALNIENLQKQASHSNRSSTEILSNYNSIEAAYDHLDALEKFLKSENQALLSGAKRSHSSERTALVEQWLYANHLHLAIKEWPKVNPREAEQYQKRQKGLKSIKVGDLISVPTGEESESTYEEAKLLKRGAKDWLVETGDGGQKLFSRSAVAPYDSDLLVQRKLLSGEERAELSAETVNPPSPKSFDDIVFPNDSFQQEMSSDQHNDYIASINSSARLQDAEKALTQSLQSVREENPAELNLIAEQTISHFNKAQNDDANRVELLNDAYNSAFHLGLKNPEIDSPFSNHPELDNHFCMGQEGCSPYAENEKLNEPLPTASQVNSEPPIREQQNEPTPNSLGSKEDIIYQDDGSDDDEELTVNNASTAGDLAQVAERNLKLPQSNDPNKIEFNQEAEEKEQINKPAPAYATTTRTTVGSHLFAGTAGIIAAIPVGLAKGIGVMGGGLRKLFNGPENPTSANTETARPINRAGQSLFNKAQLDLHLANSQQMEIKALERDINAHLNAIDRLASSSWASHTKEYNGAATDALKARASSLLNESKMLSNYVVPMQEIYNGIDTIQRRTAKLIAENKEDKETQDTLKLMIDQWAKTSKAKVETLPHSQERTDISERLSNSFNSLVNTFKSLFTKKRQSMGMG